MSLRDRDRMAALRQMAEGVLGPKEAAERLGLTSRQFRRMRRRWETDGDSAVMHRGRGRASNRRLRPELRGRVLETAADPLYVGFGPTWLSEHLATDAQGGAIHPSTLRLWIVEAGQWEVEPVRVWLRAPHET